MLISFDLDSMTFEVIVGTILMLALPALAIFLAIFAWKRTQKGNGAPGRSAAIRAAVLTGIFAPSIMPGVHGVLPLPSGLVVFIMLMNAVTGDPMPGLGGEALMLMFAIPAVVFVVLWGFFARRLSA